ncbi:MAG: hypothetical protein JSS67_07010 [Bacteroidetes bacterium]|nr:hypothetical protein [Bacteroidota bacterium]
MHLREVKDQKDEISFIRIADTINKENPHYIPFLHQEVKDVFNPLKNKYFRDGEAIRWILKDDANNCIGRIAAFTHQKYINKGTSFPTGCFGFFDCINNQEAANLLLDTARKWLSEKGMEAMDGPVNFGDRDKWWGLMVEGFDRDPIYGMSFNPPYYQKLLEEYGMKNYYNQYYYALWVNDPIPPRFPERYAKFASKPDYSARHIRMSNLEKHAHEFATVYNAAWAQHDEAKEITAEQVLKLFNKMKPIMDERIIWFAYYKEEPIAMWINIPDLNVYFKHFNGKFGWLEKLRLMWMKKTGQCKNFTGVAFGIVPKFQALGVDSFMIYAGSLLIQKKHLYDTYEMGWAGDWNPKMVNIYKSLGAKQSRQMVVYRKIFDEHKNPFERHPIIN